LLLGAGSNHGKMPRVRGGIDSNALARDFLLGFASGGRAAGSAIVLGERAFARVAGPMILFSSRRVGGCLAVCVVGAGDDSACCLIR